MNCNSNEKYLLKFISSLSVSNKENELMETILNLGIKLKFQDLNPVYQIIDELTYSKYIANKNG